MQRERGETGKERERGTGGRGEGDRERGLGGRERPAQENKSPYRRVYFALPIFHHWGADHRLGEQSDLVPCMFSGSRALGPVIIINHSLGEGNMGME